MLKQKTQLIHVISSPIAVSRAGSVAGAVDPAFLPSRHYTLLTLVYAKSQVLLTSLRAVSEFSLTSGFIWRPSAVEYPPQ